MAIAHRRSSERPTVLIIGAGVIGLSLGWRLAQRGAAVTLFDRAAAGSGASHAAAGMLAVCAAGRILNPKSARSQVIGAMTMGVGAALMEELAVDKRLGFFVNHDLAGYEVPVHADIPHPGGDFSR